MSLLQRMTIIVLVSVTCVGCDQGTNSLALPERFSFEPEMVKIKGRCFQMGGDSRSHQTCLEDFYIGKYEVTLAEFRVFIDKTGYRTDAEDADRGIENLFFSFKSGCFSERGENRYGFVRGLSWRDPGFIQGKDHPVVCISWRDAIAYTNWLQQETGKLYRLPTGEEWEFSARAGTKTKFPWGNEVS